MFDNLKLKHYQKKGYQALNKSQLEKAISYFEKALFISDKAEIMFNYAVALSGLSRYEEAYTVLRKILDMYEDNEMALSMMVWVCTMLREWDRAIFYVEKIMLQYPTNTEFASIYDIIYDEEKRETFVSVNERIKTAERFKLQKDYDQAIKMLESVISLDPTRALAYHNIGAIYLLKKEKTKAKEYLQKAVELAPKNNAFKKSLNKII